MLFKNAKEKRKMYLIWRFLGIGMDCLSSMLLLMPAVLVFQKITKRKLWSLHTGFLLLYVCTLAGIFSVTGLPNAKYWQIDFSVNIIPMADIWNSPMQYFMNILMFVPIGFLLPLLWEPYKDWKRVMGFGCFLTVFIEVAQIFTFRTTDIDDLLTNLLGACIGFMLVKILGEKLKVPLPVEPDSGKMKKAEPVIVFFGAFLVNFFVQPYWSAFFWDSVLA